LGRAKGGIMSQQETNRKKKILLIDDDASLLVTLSDFLKFEGYEVVTADSGEQGLKRLEKMTPDLIILDMSMPGMGGVGFLKAISSETGKPAYPVLVLTARANMAEFFATVDVDGFVAKPCDPQDLLMEVGRIIFLRSGEKPQPGEVRFGSTKVLLGEDDPVVSENLTTAFVDAGFLVDHATKGGDVLERAIVGKPDIIVVKRVLASMNGDAVAAMLKEMPNTRDIPVVLYDETDTGGGVGRYEKPGTGIRKFVSSNNSVVLLQAVRAVIGG